jgi:hypothetical protein
VVGAGLGVLVISAVSVGENCGYSWLQADTQSDTKISVIIEFLFI